MTGDVHYPESCPQDCPAAPVQPGGAPIPCSMMEIRTRSESIKYVTQCTRCGYIDAAELDRWTESWYKSRIGSMAQRIALASDGEPFTFIRTSQTDISLHEALGQALGAASMCWEFPHAGGVFQSERAVRIYDQLWKLIQEKTVPR
jgi:hypothetical protein